MEQQYCLFYKNEKLQFGWVREVRKNKLVVVPEQGKEFVCASSRMEYVWKGSGITNEKEALEYLSQMSQRCRKQSEEIELEVIHELCEERAAYSLDALAQSFLDDHENGWQRTALLLKLKSDNKLFQQKKNLFYARSNEELSEIEEQEEKRQEAEKRQAIETEWAQSLLAKKLPAMKADQQGHWDQFVQRLRNFIVHFEKSQEKDYFCTLFQCQIKDAEKAEKKLLKCLSLTNRPMSWGKLVIERSSADFSYDQDEIEASNNLRRKEISQSRFECPTIDQRGLEAFTVDHENTLDYDDALSWEETEQGSIIRVHITDVASSLSEDSILFEKASDRFSSLYTIKHTYSMFEESLSEDLFSLKQNEERAVLTFEFIVDPLGNIVSTDIYRSLIFIKDNLSYEKIDVALKEGHSFWPDLWNFCTIQAKKRKENGALELDRCEVKLDISDPDNIKLEKRRENTPASLLIQELAILTNHLAAQFSKNRELPCLYRNQPPYSITRELEEGEKPALKDINIQPARISLIPEGHSALGLDCYLQITSPIRRFLDLVNQTIVLSSLGNREIRFSSEELLNWARRGEETQREFNVIERRLLDHWKIKYLEQHASEEFEAQFIRLNRNGKAQINLLNLQLFVELPAESIPQQETFQVKIDVADSSLNKVVARVCSPAIPEEESRPAVQG